MLCGNLLDTVILFSSFFCCFTCHLHIVTLPVGLYCYKIPPVSLPSLYLYNEGQSASNLLKTTDCNYHFFCSRKPISFSFEVGKKLSALSETLFQFRGQCDNACFSKGTEERSCHFYCYYH